MKLFVDSSGWTALFNPRDQYHLQIHRQAEMIVGQRNRLITTDYVLDETITNLMSAVNHAAFVVMQQQDLRDAFAFDHHFEQMGFRLWPR